MAVCVVTPMIDAQQPSTNTSTNASRRQSREQCFLLSLCQIHPFQNSRAQSQPEPSALGSSERVRPENTPNQGHRHASVAFSKIFMYQYLYITIFPGRYPPVPHLILSSVWCLGVPLCPPASPPPPCIDFHILPRGPSRWLIAVNCQSGQGQARQTPAHRHKESMPPRQWVRPPPKAQG